MMKPPTQPGRGGLRKSLLAGPVKPLMPMPLSPDDAAGAGTPEPDSAAWAEYWDDMKKVELPDRGGTFNVYCAGSSGPVVLAIHGAGYTGCTWSLVAANLKSKCRVFAPDLRGHGRSTVQPDHDFSYQTMADDVVGLWHALVGSNSTGSRAQPAQAADAATLEGQPAAPSPAPPTQATVIVGHSMGGAMAVWAAASGRIPELAGCCVVDVVEGTAIAALPHMMNVVSARPTSFPSPAAAVKWAVRSGMSKCKAAAAVSIPSQLMPASSTAAAAEAQADAGIAEDPLTQAQQGMRVMKDTINEDEEYEGEEDRPGQPSPAPSPLSAVPEAMPAPKHQPAALGADVFRLPRPRKASSEAESPDACVWRTSLAATQPYWEGWYTGMSEAFLGLRVPKMLLLAGTDRLDKALTIGQMQGKFQLVILPTAGHAIQEDDAPALSAAIEHFISRQRIGQPPLTFPKAQSGTQPVLPIVAGVVHKS